METENAVIAKSVYCAAIALAAAWLSGMIFPSLLAKFGWLGLAVAARGLFAPVCHQIISRSFELFGFPLAVCARCTGVYCGAIFGLALLGVLRRRAAVSMPPRSILLAGLAPAAFDFIAGVLGLTHTSSAERFATGVIAGAVASFFVYPGILSFVLLLSDRRAGRKDAAAPQRFATTSPRMG